MKPIEELLCLSRISLPVVALHDCCTIGSLTNGYLRGLSRGGKQNKDRQSRALARQRRCDDEYNGRLPLHLDLLLKKSCNLAHGKFSKKSCNLAPDWQLGASTSIVKNYLCYSVYSIDVALTCDSTELNELLYRSIPERSLKQN